MAAGVVFSLLAALTLNAGNLVQKHAVSALPAFSARRINHLIRTLVTSREWVAGFLLCLIGVALEIMAFALAPIAVVQSIFNAGVVLLVVFPRLKMGERLRRNEWIGLAIVVAALISLSASLTKSTNSVGLSGSGPRVLLAVGPTLVVVVLVVAAIRSSRGAHAFLYGSAAGLLYGAAALGTKGASTLLVRHGVVASVPRILTSVYPYVFLVLSALAMLIYQIGLQRFPISLVGSMSDVVASTYLVAVGMIVFDESLPKNTTTLSLRLGGFVGILLGSVLVATAGRRGGAETRPPIESDLGVGSVLLTELDAHLGHSMDELVAGPPPDQRS
jgi:drug/metabolite transporter (DMT)-like permease